MITSVDYQRVLTPMFPDNEQAPLTSAKQLKIVAISSERAHGLNLLWHSRMPRLDCYNICSPCYCAYYDNLIYAVALWSLPIAANRLINGTKLLELRRLAIAEDAPKFTATRMLSLMAKDISRNRPDILRLISYQDTGVHTGTIYKAANWTIERTSEYQSWGIHSQRPGQIEQSQSPKVRWGFPLCKSTNRAKPPEAKS